MDREGQRSVFVRYRRLKTRQKKVSDMKSQLWGGGGRGLDGGGHPPAQKSRFLRVYFAADRCGLKGCCNAVLVTHGSVGAAAFVNGPPM